MMNNTCGICEKLFTKDDNIVIRSGFLYRIAMKSGHEKPYVIDEENNILHISLDERSFVHDACNKQELYMLMVDEIDIFDLQIG